MSDFQEKRSKPRIQQKLAIKVMEGDYCAVVETNNISESGVYFTADRPLPLMSRVAITLLLPTGSGKNSKIECGGTVVRTAPIASNIKITYDTAIFFNDINEKTKNLISRHIKKIITGGFKTI
ncbi:MAG: PilZ domain-containing protein [Candidatus Omnitrophica bacterium]|nr:PilZ domain-containing protein [Candidatus Omnitrophota bacterium]